jgi:mannose/cellobiose epimerase-like protein (N-acyl-D-glucosamine 2-epimerase family)
LALFELLGRDPRAPVATASRLLLDRYLKPNGAWIDRLDERGHTIAGPTPASTFYHVFLAFAEALRLEPLLK